MSVVIVGAGVAGAAAALAAQAAGARVLVASGPPGASALCAGAWDVAFDPKAVRGDRSDARPTIETAAQRLAALRRQHPYARLGLGAAREAHAAVLSRLGAYASIVWEAPLALVATDLGAVRTTATAQSSVLRLDSLPAGTRVAVVELAGYRELDALHVAQSLTDWATETRADLTFVPVEVDFLTRRSDALLAPHEIARMVEASDGVARLGAALSDARTRLPFGAALLPGVLGVADAATIVDRLRALAGVPVGEMLAGPGTPQGLRLHAAIEALLADIPQAPARVVGVDVERHRARAVRLEDGTVVAASAVVLATGRFLGGGLVKEGRVREPILDLPLYLDGRPATLVGAPFGADPTALFGQGVFDRHDALRLGVGWDDRLRPLGRDGAVAAANLFAAGDLLEGHDPTTDGSGLGVAATTGFWAGRWAAEARGA